MADHGRVQRTPVLAQGLAGLAVIERHEHNRRPRRALTQPPWSTAATTATTG